MNFNFLITIINNYIYKSTKDKTSNYLKSQSISKYDK